MIQPLHIFNDCQRATLACDEGVHCGACAPDPSLRRQAAQFCGGPVKACPRGLAVVGDDETFPEPAGKGRPEPRTPPPSPPNEPNKPILAQPGPGDMLHDIIRSLGFEPAAGCQCNARIRQMNQWWRDEEGDTPLTLLGLRRYWKKHEADVNGWLQTEADQRGIVVTRRMKLRALLALWAAYRKSINLTADPGNDQP